MPSVGSGEKEKLAGEVDAGQLWTVEVTGAPVRLATRRNRADDGTLVRDGDLFFVGTPQGSALWAYGDGSAAADVTLDAVSGDFPTQSGSLYVEPLLRSQVSGTIDADVIDRPERELGLVDVDAQSGDGSLSGAIGSLNFGGDFVQTWPYSQELEGENELPLQSSLWGVTTDNTYGLVLYRDRSLVSAGYDSVSVADRTLSGLSTGQATVATAGASVQFNGGATIDVPAGSTVRVSAPSSNAGDVYVGDSSVDASTGYVLAPGDSEEFPVSDVATLYADADNADDVATWAVVGA